jgi:tetratricopeptide (TPR) repeat protein
LTIAKEGCMHSSSGLPKLSLAIIVRNGESLLARTLASVEGLADEIVVLDTGSTDDTLHVALEAGAVAHRRAWEENFAAARNACLDQTTGDWILWLDVGETIASEDIPLLRHFVQHSANRDRAYRIDVVLPPSTGQTGCEQKACLRLHPRSAGLRFKGRVRERLDLSSLALQIEPLPALFDEASESAREGRQVDIHRGSEELATERRRSKAQRNIRLADFEQAEQGPSADIQNCLAEAFQSLGDCLRAGQHYRQALAASAPHSRERLEAHYGLLTCFEGRREDQLALCMAAVEQFPLDAQLLVALGGYLQSLGHLELAARAFDVAFRYGQIEPEIWHLPDIREIAAACAARTFERAGNAEQARSLLEAAVRMHPQSRHLERIRLDAAPGGGPSDPSKLPIGGKTKTRLTLP